VETRTPLTAAHSPPPGFIEADIGIAHVICSSEPYTIISATSRLAVSYSTSTLATTTNATIYMCMLEAALAALRELGSRAKNIGVLGVFGEGQGDAGKVLIAQRSWFRLPRVRRNPFSYSSNSVLNFLCLSSEVNILY
jgi:hypothetical protein